MIRQKFSIALSEAIRIMWWNGLPTEVIAARVNVDSPESVANHCHKMRYHRRPGFTHGKPTHAKHRDLADPKHEPKPKQRDDQPITLINALTDECRWMHANGADAPLCAHQTLPGDSYCPHHAARAYNYSAYAANASREDARATLHEEQVRHAR